MQIRNYLTLVLMVFSTTSFGADAVQMFATKSECLRHFTLSSGTSNVIAGEAYCKDKVVKSATDICADKKLLEFKKINSISSAQEAQYFQKYKLECISASTATGAAQQTNQTAQIAERDAQVAQQQAAMAAQQQAAAAAKQNQQTAAAAKQDLQQAAGLIKAFVPVVDKVQSAYDKAAAKPTTASATAPATQTAVVTPPSAPATEAAAVTPPSAPATEAAAVTPPSVAPTPAVEATVTAGGKPYTEADIRDMTFEKRTEVFAQNKKELADKASEASAQGDALKKAAPGTAEATDGAVSAAEQGGNVSPPPSEMTVASGKADAELKTQLNSTATSSGAKLLVGMVQTRFVETQTALTSGINPIITAYEGVKKTCLGLAEKTEFLCVEGTSPGAVATKTLMNVAGPILAVVNSAQKACSNTSKVTSLAGTVLTVAKGVCMASQLACTTSCTAAIAKLNASVATYSAQVNAAATLDQGNTAWECSVGYFDGSIILCEAQAQAKFASVPAILAQIKTIAQKEAAPTPGTSAGLGAKCKLKIADALMMGINIASLVMAKNSADECDKKLAASGTAGGNVTPTQYCETPGNSSTQFCKCKQNANQEGCPGFAGKGSLIDKDANKDSVVGINLKTGKGLSSFAGGSSGTATGFGPNGKQEFNPSAPGTGEKLALTGADAVAAESGGGYGGGSAGGGGSSAGGGASAGEGAGGKPENKKWSFGSFANALGGMFGGGSGSKGGNSKGNGNALSSKQEAAIKRKIASDKLAGEITSASGKSNWEKVHQVYKIKDSTLLTGN